MEGRKKYLLWLAFNFLWWVLVSFLLAYTPVWMEAMILPFALAILLTQMLALKSFISRIILPGGLAISLALALAGNLLGAQTRYVATAFATVVFWGWTVPGVVTLIAVISISLHTAIVRANGLPWSMTLAASGIGILAGLLAVTLPEVVFRARNELLNSFSKGVAFLILSGTSIAGLILGTLVSLILP